MNPFNKLKVHRDEEDNVVTTNTTTSVNTAKSNTPLFNTNKPEEKKKVKQRPPKDEKTGAATTDDNEGFEYVGKLPKKNPRTNNNLNSEFVSYETKPGTKDTLVNDNKPHYKRGDKYDNTFKPRTNNKREFDRHSGTGRGKEVKKSGAGGRGTWGNTNVEAKREVVDYDDTDYYFNKALNPKATKEEVLTETNNTNTKTKEETTTTTTKVEGENKTETKVEGETEVAKDGEGKTDDKKKKRKNDKKEEEVDEKDKLVIPENAITFEEFKKKRQENKGNTNENKEVKVEINLEAINSKKDTSGNVNTNTTGAKKGKAKNTKVNAKELEANKYLGNLIVEDNSKPSYNKERNYEKKNKNTGVKYNEKEFPELK